MHQFLPNVKIFFRIRSRYCNAIILAQKTSGAVSVIKSPNIFCFDFLLAPETSLLEACPLRSPFSSVLPLFLYYQ